MESEEKIRKLLLGIISDCVRAAVNDSELKHQSLLMDEQSNDIVDGSVSRIDQRINVIIGHLDTLAKAVVEKNRSTLQ